MHDYLQEGDYTQTIHKGPIHAVPGWGLCMGEGGASTGGGLYTKVVSMQYQEGDYAWGRGIYRRGTIHGRSIYRRGTIHGGGGSIYRRGTIHKSCIHGVLGRGLCMGEGHYKQRLYTWSTRKGTMHGGGGRGHLQEGDYTQRLYTCSTRKGTMHGGRGKGASRGGGLYTKVIYMEY